jgi:16S rRNA (adenine1518-N6/adenine1519-N6)-dimethyltransferase
VSLPRARKRFGQHFLEPAWITKVIGVVSPTPSDHIVEIGPGRGALTRPLAARAQSLVAVELDRDLVSALDTDAPPNVRVVQGDFLNVDLQTLLAGKKLPCRVVANLPYNVASPILFRLLEMAEAGRMIADAILMLQREVADRLIAKPGDRNYGSLTLQVGLDADVTRLLTLPPGAFRPVPKVNSAVVRVLFRPPVVDVGSRVVFRKLVRGVYLQRRKTLLNALRPIARTLGVDAAELIASARLNPQQRPQTLSISDMAELSRAVL